MRVIALMNQKGGVGKTTTTVNLGAALAEAGKKVCMIDLDPQSHLTINYGVEPNSESIVNLYHVLVDGKSFLEAVQEVGKNIAIVPGSIDLAAAEIELVTVVGREKILKEKIDAAQHDFDFLLLDCPPSLGLLTINALSLADEVIIPMQPHFLALQGVAKLLETVHLVSRRINPNLKVGGIVLTMFDAQTKLTTEVVAELQRFIEEARGKNLPWSSARIFNSKIRRNIKLAESPSFGQTILTYDSASHGAADYRALAREVLGEAPLPPPPVAAPAVEKKVVAPLVPASTAVAPVTTAIPKKSPAPTPVVSKPSTPPAVTAPAAVPKPVAKPVAKPAAPAPVSAPAPVAAKPATPTRVPPKPSPSAPVKTIKPVEAPAPKPTVTVTVAPGVADIPVSPPPPAPKPIPSKKRSPEPAVGPQ